MPKTPMTGISRRGVLLMTGSAALAGLGACGPGRPAVSDGPIRPWPTDARGRSLPHCETIHESIGDVRIEVNTLDWSLHHRDRYLSIKDPYLFVFTSWARPDKPQPYVVPLLGTQAGPTEYDVIDDYVAVQLDFDGGPSVRRVVPAEKSPGTGYRVIWPDKDRALQQQLLAACKAARGYRIRIEQPESGFTMREGTWSLKGFSRAVARAETLVARQMRDQAEGRC